MNNIFTKFRKMAIVVFALVFVNSLNAQNKITFTTDNNIGDQVHLVIDAAPADRQEVWLDVNNNGVKDSGESIIEFSSVPYDETSYTIASQSLTLYGKVTLFSCNNNRLTSLDVSQNIALTDLRCHDNQLRNLDVTKNIALTTFWCYENRLTSLDVSNNTALTNFYCDGNQLTSLDVSKNIDLITFGCYDNRLTSLDLSNNTALISLKCAYNKLTSLDVSKNVYLAELYCEGNQLTGLDLYTNSYLIELWCEDNQLTSLDVSNNVDLTTLACDDNQLTNLDVSYNTALTRLWVFNNQLTSLNVDNQNNNNMRQMWAQNNPNLFCIQHDSDFDPVSNNDWLKDINATWSNACNKAWSVEFISFPTKEEFEDMFNFK